MRKIVGRRGERQAQPGQAAQPPSYLRRGSSMLGAGADQLDGVLSLAGAAKPGLGSKSGTPRFSGGGSRASLSKGPSGGGSQGGTSSRGQPQGNDRGEGALPEANVQKNVRTVRLEERQTSPRSLKLAVGGRLWVMGENRRGQCGVQAGKGRAKGGEMWMVSLPSQVSILHPRTTVLVFLLH